ncbi:NAD(P)/FAD-dependent oxidoreductase [Fluviicola chungangensis]|uniref:TIGR03862 family flavoprotein n=1 Tax=Fluviicola chungangensis TaxID=2597671 RepID=A0A556N3R8_9FLAO|nr:TIGR03862 family flavoprotein [Fluviicola chungangensis]TSJ46735.1 TIGR03862 family flavoprotein [Fluviicola chungangensis]
MKRVLIIGGGPAGLMAATQLLKSDCEILLLDHKASVGRKFLVAGDGGFNLTHSETPSEFRDKYDSEWIRQTIRQFSNKDWIKFLKQIGVETKIGSSGKIFPADDIKPIQVLNAWKSFLEPKVQFLLNTRFVNFDHKQAVIEREGKSEKMDFDYLVLALGGKSWPVTGSDGAWTAVFEQKMIELTPFQASNSGLVLYENWLGDLEGKILKNIRVTCGNQSCSGDLVCTSYGLEGKPVYAVNGALRKMEKPVFKVDLKPQMSLEKVFEVLKKAKNPSQGLKELKLGEVAIFWIRNFVSKERFLNPKELAKAIKEFPIGIRGFRPIEEVISCAGGVSVSEISASGELNRFPNVFVAGEMIDWDAPTGGYLIQGCVSSGYVSGKAIKLSIMN